MKRLGVMIAVLVITSSAVAAGPFANPFAGLSKDRSYWTKETIVLVAADAVAKSLDMMYTMKNAGQYGFQEYDPLGRPFVEHGRAIAGLSQGMLFASEVLVSYELNRHRHPRMGHALLLLGIGGNTTGIATSTH